MSTATGRARTPAAHDIGWMQHGLCAQTYPDLFFPEGRGAAITTEVEKAKQVCNRCPVKDVCLAWALDTGQTAGVWGGLSEDERRSILRKRAEYRKSSYERCIDEQEYIEERAANGISHRLIAEELGVCRTAVGRACRLFESERQMSQDGQVAAA